MQPTDFVSGMPFHSVPTWEGTGVAEHRQPRQVSLALPSPQASILRLAHSFRDCPQRLYFVLSSSRSQAQRNIDQAEDRKKKQSLIFKFFLEHTVILCSLAQFLAPGLGEQDRKYLPTSDLFSSSSWPFTTFIFRNRSLHNVFVTSCTPFRFPFLTASSDSHASAFVHSFLSALSQTSLYFLVLLIVFYSSSSSYSV